MYLSNGQRYADRGRHHGGAHKWQGQQVRAGRVVEPASPGYQRRDGPDPFHRPGVRLPCDDVKALGVNTCSFAIIF